MDQIKLYLIIGGLNQYFNLCLKLRKARTTRKKKWQKLPIDHDGQEAQKSFIYNKLQRFLGLLVQMGLLLI